MLSFKMKMGGGSLLLQHINKEQWMKNMLLCDVFFESVSSLYRFISVFFLAGLAELQERLDGETWRARPGTIFIS